MTDPRPRHEAWFLQAEDDLRWGYSSLAAGHFAQACFVAQQVGEKALKSLAFHRGFDVIKSHSIARIADDLGFDGDIAQVATALDLYYISARYPDALPDGIAPFEHFTQAMARQALDYAQTIVERVRDERAVTVSVLRKYLPRHPLLPSNIEDIEGRLRRALQGRVDGAYMFGSAATGKYHCASDIDLILITESKLPFASRGTEFADLFRIYPNLDILVYSRREFDSLIDTPGPGFWQSVRESKRRLL